MRAPNETPDEIEQKNRPINNNSGSSRQIATVESVVPTKLTIFAPSRDFCLPNVSHT